MDEKAAEAVARADGNVLSYLEGAAVKRVIYVPNRLLNFVLE